MASGESSRSFLYWIAEGRRLVLVNLVDINTYPSLTRCSSIQNDCFEPGPRNTLPNRASYLAHYFASVSHPAGDSAGND